MVKQMNDKWKYILLLVPALAVFYNNLYNEQPGTHIDEVYWIGSTYYYHLLVEEMHWSHSDWQLLPAQENPPVGKYFMGGGGSTFLATRSQPPTCSDPSIWSSLPKAGHGEVALITKSAKP